MTRFGLQLPSFTFPDVPDDKLFDRITEIAQAAECSGFDSFWVMDHYHQIGTSDRRRTPCSRRTRSSAPWRRARLASRSAPW